MLITTLPISVILVRQETSDGGEAILRALRDLDVDLLVSSPGSEWPALWEALAKQITGKKNGPRYVGCWHETIATSLAMGYAQVTGKGQAVFLHTGAGLLQGSIAIRSAYRDQIPMLVCVGESASLGQDPRYDMGDHWMKELPDVTGPERFAEHFSKWSTEVKDPHVLYDVVRRAAEIASRTPCGPAVVSIPMEVMYQQWTPPQRPGKKMSTNIGFPDGEAVKQVANIVSESEYPLILTDNIGRTIDGFKSLVEFSHRFSIPVVESSTAHYTNFPQDDPLYLGDDVAPFLERTDLFLVIAERAPWYPKNIIPPNRDATIVAIDFPVLRTDMPIQPLYPDLVVEANPAQTMKAIVERLTKGGGPGRRKIEERFAWSKKEHDRQDQVRLAEEKEALSQKSGIDPVRLCATIQRLLPSDTTFVEETIVHGRAIRTHIRRSAPQTFFRPSGGGLGLGLGTSLGVKLALRGRMVATLIGDGSFLYNPALQAFGAARDNGIPLMVVVFNNKSYASMKNAHLRRYPEGLAPKSGLFFPILGPDYAELVKPFEGVGMKVEDPDELDEAIRKAMGAAHKGKIGLVNVELNS